MAEMAIIAAVAGGTLSAAGSVMAGREKSRAEMFNSQQKTREAQEYKIAAAQVEARRREALTSSLETIQSIRAGRGVGEGSPTAMAMFDEIISDESRDIRTERLNYLTRAEQARMASKMSKKQSKMSLIGGYMQAGADIAGTVSKVAGGRTSSSSGVSGYHSAPGR